jgi:hypothetical protein
MFSMDRGASLYSPVFTEPSRPLVDPVTVIAGGVVMQRGRGLPPEQGFQAVSMSAV